MDENAKRIQSEVAKDKIQVILASIALAVLIIMEFYVMINYKSNFMAMAVGVLLMIITLFFLISGVIDMSIKQKQMEEQKYDEIYNAQKASYLVIKKSFDEMEQRLRAIEENSSLPAEDIINAQKAVAKVTISRSKENTDALMNSNDELINQLVSIQEKLENNNSQILEKQQTLLKETNFDIQQKIAAITNQLSSIEGRIQGGFPMMAAQPVQMVAPTAAPQMAPPPPAAPIMEEPVAMDEMPAMEEAPVEDLGLDLDAVEEETPVEDLGIDLEAVAEEPADEEIPLDIDLEVSAGEPVAEEAPVEDLGIDLEAVAEEPAAEEIPLDIDLEAPVEEPTVAEEAPVEDLGIDLEAVVEEPAAEEAPIDIDLEAPAEEPVAEEVQVDIEIPVEEPVAETPAEEIVLEETPAEEAQAEEIVLEASPAEEAPAEDIGANLDALLEEIGPIEEEAPAEEPAPEPEAAPAEEAPKDEVVIPDVGVDLTDPNRVMSAEEIEKLFASI